MEHQPFFEADDEDDDESEDSSVVVPKPSKREAEPEPEVEAEPEPDEAEAPLEHLSEAEQLVVEQELVEELPPVEAESVAPADELAAAAVESFRDKIIIEAMPAEEAFQETLAELEPDEPVAPPEAPVEMPAEDETVWLHVSAPSAASPRPAPAPQAERPTPPAPETKPATAALVTGYLLGRRRGRIKTERKLRPVQKKLEKQVEQLRSDLTEKEATIRQVAHERAAKKPAAVEQIKERLTVMATKPEKPPRPQVVPTPEHIGSVVVRAEKEQPVVEKLPEQPIETSAQRLAIERHVETLTRSELMQVASKVIIEGASLRQLYETNQIGEHGLRRLVSEHLRGKDVKKALKRELVEHQIDFERDPAMRDFGAAAAMPGLSPSLNTLLEQVNQQATAEQRQELAVWKARAAHQAATAQKTQRRRRAADISMTATIAVLLALVIILLLSRR